MTGDIYDHLLIIGTFCSFIQRMIKAWLLHNLLIRTLKEILQKSSWKNYASAGILGRELLASRPGFTRPGMPDSASPEITEMEFLCTKPLTAPLPLSSCY